MGNTSSVNNLDPNPQETVPEETVPEETVTNIYDLHNQIAVDFNVNSGNRGGHTRFVYTKPITAADVLARDPTAKHYNNVVEDVLEIVNNGKQYSPRGGTEEFRIPEDISTEIARIEFGVDAYDEQETKRVITLEDVMWCGDKSARDKDVAVDVLLIVNSGKRYEPRGDTEEIRYPEDKSVHIARTFFGVNAYEPTP